MKNYINYRSENIISNYIENSFVDEFHVEKNDDDHLPFGLPSLAAHSAHSTHSVHTVDPAAVADD